MKLVIYSLILNHHQAPIADEFFRRLGDDFTFVELEKSSEYKGGQDNFSNRPYLIKAWNELESYNRAMHLSVTADVCIFSGYQSLPFAKVRMRYNMLSFDMSERWLKRGLINLLSPRIFNMWWTYINEGWSRKQIYKLCSSAFAVKDQQLLHTYVGKCYKWGYFTTSDLTSICANKVTTETRHTSLLWCARFLTWKHPELPVLLAERLKKDGYDVAIDMYGDEGSLAPHDKPYRRKDIEALIDKLGVNNMVTLKGNRPNSEILKAMQEGDIFLFTSDRLEGWGAVANESMANGCVLVASDAIGSTHYLVKHKETGMIFRSCDLDSLYEQVKYLLDNPDVRKQISKAGRESMVKLWSPQNAAKSLLQLIEDIQAGRETSITEGPCSKA